MGNNSGPPQHNFISTTSIKELGKTRLFQVVFGHFEALIFATWCGLQGRG